jgi:thiamine biosynthesis lipoprotein
MIACVATLALVAAGAPRQDVLRTWTGAVMGTELLIEAVGPDGESLDLAIAAAVAELERVEDLMTDWRPSELTRLNDAAGAGPHTVPHELARHIARGVKFGELTGGAFDITYAGVGKLWDFKRVPPVVPDAATVAAALEVVGYQRLGVDLEADTVELPEGMRIGLGGIAKGYGVDRAMKVLMDHGVEHGLVNAGGDLKALGRKLGESWQIAIRHPREEERVLAVIPVVNTCVVTSGDYARFFEHDGVRYHHIIDPRTGYPSTGCMSATVVAPDAAAADALATAMCVLGPEEGLAIIEKLPRVEALLVDMEGAVHVSAGLRQATGQ